MRRANGVSLCTHTVQSCRRLKGMSEAVLVSHCCCNKSPQRQWLKTSQTYYYCGVSMVKHRSCSANEMVSAAVASLQEALGKLFPWFVFLSIYGLPLSFVYDYFLIHKPSSGRWGLCKEGFFSFFLCSGSHILCSVSRLCTGHTQTICDNHPIPTSLLVGSGRMFWLCEGIFTGTIIN